MTDKVQKIREKVAKLQKRAEHNFDISLTENERQFWLGESNVLTLIGKYIDTMQEEPVSEELDKAAIKFSKGWAEWDYASACFKAGAEWQKEQFEKNRLAACDKQTEKEAEIESDFVMNIIKNEHRQPTFDDAIKYGMRLHKEQMMSKAIDVEVKVDAGGYPYIPQIELYDYDKDMPFAKEGDKVKVIVTKED